MMLGRVSSFASSFDSCKKIIEKNLGRRWNRRNRRFLGTPSTISRVPDLQIKNGHRQNDFYVRKKVFSKFEQFLQNLIFYGGCPRHTVSVLKTVSGFWEESYFLRFPSKTRFLCKALRKRLVRNATRYKRCWNGFWVEIFDIELFHFL